MTDASADADRVADALLASAMGGRMRRRRARFHPLTVRAVTALTDDAVEVSFDVPERLAAEYDYLPGQYVAVRTELDGRRLRRSYSLCRPPTPGLLSIAVKREGGGRFSTWAQTELHPGDAIEVMSPRGRFTTGLDDLAGRHLAAVAAGSGIAPVLALATAVLRRSETSRFTLVYANRSHREVMFLDDLADLKDRHPARFAVHHVFSQERRTAPVLSGRIDRERFETILDALVPPRTVDEWFLCGPLALVELCREALTGRGVERTHIRHELFTSGRPGPVPVSGPVPADETVPVGRRIRFTLDGQSASVLSPASADETILNAALRVRDDVPYACAGGVCGTCRARLLEGDVRMSENYALEPEELAEGYILTCQSHPTTDEVVVDYDV